MVSLSDFLVQRIAEDEATARIEHVGRDWRVDDEGCCVLVGHEYDPDVETHFNGTAEHIARHDPARVFAECEAKRRIVAHLAEFHEWDEPYLLALLAAVYADHRDYREEWAQPFEPVTPPAPRGHFVDERDPACVAQWPGCSSFEYDPACCRFPKSCSAGSRHWVASALDDAPTPHTPDPSDLLT